MKAMNTHKEEKGEFKVKLPRVLHREESLTEVTYLSAFLPFLESLKLVHGTRSYALQGLIGINFTTREELLGGSTQLDLFFYLVGQIRLLHAPPAGAETGLQGHPLHALRQLQNS